MAVQLYIIYNGINLNFQTDGYEVVGGFYPQTADDSMESITDQFNIVIRGSSGSDLHSKISNIRLAFEHAKNHKNDVLAAWFYFAVDDNEDAYMSKMKKGDIIFESKLELTWRNRTVTATIFIEHQPYWDAVDEIQVPLTNGNGTDDISGLNVFNCDDGSGASPNKRNNWVSIDGDDIIGDLLSPTRLEILNNYATGRLYNIWIGQNWTDPANFQHFLEGEDATGGTPAGDAGCSGGQYNRYTLSDANEHEMFTWALDSTFLDACKSQWYKFMIRFKSGDPAGVKFRVKLQYNITDIWGTGQILVDQHRALTIRDLINLRLPPWLSGETDIHALDLILSGQILSGSKTVDIDYIQLTPLDGWRKLECAGYGILQNERIIDNALTENCYIDDGAGGDKSGIIIPYGDPIKLYPGKDQKLYFLTHSQTMDTAQIDRTISLKIFYHPRRRVL